MNILRYFLTLILISFMACSSTPEPDLKLFNPEAFAFDIGGSWEVNATVNAKGFAQKEKGDIFISRLSYSVDLISPDADTIKSIFDDWIEEEYSEEVIDMALEAQIEIDSSFSSGTYSLVFNVKDEFSDQTGSISVDFKLTK